MPSITRIDLDSWLIPQLQEYLQIKMNKGDIQAEMDIKDSMLNKSIRLNLKQLFIVIQAMIKVPGLIGLEEICLTDSKEDNPLTRQLYITRDGARIKDITNMCASMVDIKIRNDGMQLERNWKKS